MRPPFIFKSLAFRGAPCSILQTLEQVLIVDASLGDGSEARVISRPNGIYGRISLTGQDQQPTPGRFLTQFRLKYIFVHG